MTFVHGDIRIDLRETRHLQLRVVVLLLESFKLLVIGLDLIFVMVIACYVCKRLDLLLGVVPVVLTAMHES